MTEPVDHRAEALEALEGCETFDSVAVAHALLHLADKITEMFAGAGVVLRTSGQTMNAILDEATGHDQAPVILPNGRPYKPAHDPRDWKINPESGKWISPAGREFNPTSRQALSVIRRLEQMRRNGTLYTKPLRRATP